MSQKRRGIHPAGLAPTAARLTLCSFSGGLRPATTLQHSSRLPTQCRHFLPPCPHSRELCLSHGLCCDGIGLGRGQADSVHLPPCTVAALHTPARAAASQSAACLRLVQWWPRYGAAGAQSPGVLPGRSWAIGSCQPWLCPQSPGRLGPHPE